MLPRGRAGHRRFRPISPKDTRYIVVLPVDWPGLERVQERVARAVGLSRRERYFPHVTLAGPFSLVRGTDILALLGEAARSLPATPGLVDFQEIHVFSGRRGRAVSFLLRDDRSLAACARAVNSALAPFFARCTPLDRTPAARIMHVSVAVNLPKEKSVQVHSLVRSLVSGDCEAGEPTFSRPPPRITCLAVIRRGALWRLYDFRTGAWTGREGFFRKP